MSLSPRTQGRRTPDPLDTKALEKLALRYVERFATTRARLAAYLTRKIRERGWQGAAADPAGVAQRMADLGYIDDRLYAEGKAAAMARRGLGARRVDFMLRADGIAAEDAAAIAPDVAARAVDAAIAFARRRRIGPFAVAAADRVQREKHFAAMVRGGHAPGLARRLVAMAPGDDPKILTE